MGIYYEGKCIEGTIKKLTKIDNYLVYVSENYKEGKLTTLEWLDEINNKQIVKDCTKNECH